MRKMSDIYWFFGGKYVKIGSQANLKYVEMRLTKTTAKSSSSIVLFRHDFFNGRHIERGLKVATSTDIL